MIYDMETNRIIDLRKYKIDMYPKSDDPSLLKKYTWILERSDHYPSQNMLREGLMLMPLRGLWRNNEN